MLRLRLDGAQGFHLKLSNRPDIVARLARGDVNMPNYDGFPTDTQVSEVKFEVALYELLCSEPNISASHLLYHRIPVQHVGPRLDRPKDIAGRRPVTCSCFKEQKERIMFRPISAQGERLVFLLSQPVSVYLYSIPFFRLTSPLFGSANASSNKKPKSLPVLIAPTRQFCVALITSKIEATIGNIGDMIGWEDDNNTVGPIAAAAKRSLIRLIPHIMPTDNDENSLYRLVLEHGDFGIHNMSITIDDDGLPLVTSLYDWETGSIVPAILSDPLMAVRVDLVTNENADPSITRVPDYATSSDRARYMTWATHYFQAFFNQAPDYKQAIKAGSDVRHIWFALQEWRGADPEDYFGNLGAWAE